MFKWPHNNSKQAWLIPCLFCTDYSSENMRTHSCRVYIWAHLCWIKASTGTQVTVGRETLHSNPSLIFSMTPWDIALLGWSGSGWPAGWYMSAFRARTGESVGLRWRNARGRRWCALRMLHGAHSTEEPLEEVEYKRNLKIYIFKRVSFKK